MIVAQSKSSCIANVSARISDSWRKVKCECCTAGSAKTAPTVKTRWRNVFQACGWGDAGTELIQGVNCEQHHCSDHIQAGNQPHPPGCLHWKGWTAAATWCKHSACRHEPPQRQVALLCPPAVSLLALARLTGPVWHRCWAMWRMLLRAHLPASAASHHVHIQINKQ